MAAEHLGKVMLYESHTNHLNELARQAEQERLWSALPSRPTPWRAILVTAVLVIGMIALWIH
jgi:hypothetical protein